MLTLAFSNRLDTLADLLVARLAAHPGPVLAAEPVIVPSAAVQRALTLRLARQHGVCANVGFSYLAHWLWQRMRQALPGLPAFSPLDPAVLAWRIDAAFAEPGAFAGHPRLAGYLAHADAVMRHELAQRVAALFDQYATYRPEWLRAWGTPPGEDPPALAAWQLPPRSPDAAWQATLWQQLTAGLPAEQRDPAPAFAAVLRQQGDALREAGHLPPRVQVFCLPAMPPLHLGLLQALGRVMDVHVYAINPCREFWFDVVDAGRLATLAERGESAFREVGQPLLAAWGGQVQSQLGLLVDAAGDEAGGGAIDDGRYDELPGDTLLARLHNAILDLAEPEPGSITLDDGDRSLEVHVCHSRTRELEVLQDRLLGLLAEPDPPPLDQILVVTPDLEATAPLIDAVFGTAPRERAIPYTITGRARSRANGIARALLQLLALLGSRCGVSEVYGLLQQAPVARRFGLSAEALDRVHGWLQAASVHWALDADHRDSLGLPAGARHSLADGLERLMLGYALPADVAEPFGDTLPAGPVDGAEALWLGALGRLLERLDRLRRALATGTGPHPSAWTTHLGEALDGFIAPANDELEDLREVREAVQRLAAQWQHAGFDQPLPLDVVRGALEHLLDDPARGGVPGGSVTFSAMGSLRSLPYRVVCVIGLDDGAFPTATRPPEFDLMAQRPRPGDRQRRTDERNLFLDLLLAAQGTLHLSHVGRSVRDNAVLPPSVLVSELLECLGAWFGDGWAGVRARLVVEHPLQAFAEAPFRTDSPLPLRSHHQEYADALRRRHAAPPLTLHASAFDDEDDPDDENAAPEPQQPFFAQPLPEPDAAWRVLSIDRLVAFFRHPCRFLLKERLGLQLRQPQDELQDDEAFVPGLPERSALAQRLLPALRAGADDAAVRRLAQAGTDWPAGAYAREALDRELVTLHAFAAQLQQHQAAPCLPAHLVDLAINVNGHPWRLHGGFAELRPQGLVGSRYDDARHGDLLAAWLRHLLLNAQPPAGVAPASTWIAREEVLRFGRVDNASGTLHDLLALMDQGLREPLYFFPKTAWRFVTANDSRSEALKAWRGSPMFPFGEGTDPWVRLALRGLPDPVSEAFDAFRRLAHAVLDPLLAALADGASDAGDGAAA
jgi:exodeoxyribonuclease V gamma subunit